MDINKIAKDIVNYVKTTENLTQDQIEKVVEQELTDKVVNILEPEGVYKKGEFYHPYGNYIGIVDTHPHNADYFLRKHHFAIPAKETNQPATINSILIREIKK